MSEKISDVYVDTTNCGTTVRFVVRIGETAYSTFFTGSEKAPTVAEKLHRLAKLIEAVK